MKEEIKRAISQLEHEILNINEMITIDPNINHTLSENIINNKRLSIEALQEQLDRLENGEQWIKLPCKVGDYLYCVNKYKNSDIQYKVFKCYISNYTHCKDKTSDYLTVRFVEESIIDAVVYPFMIGRHYFLTEYEALQELKEREHV